MHPALGPLFPGIVVAAIIVLILVLVPTPAVGATVRELLGAAETEAQEGRLRAATSILEEAKEKSEVFVDTFGPVARRAYAQRTFKEAQEAFDAGRLDEARSLCDRVIALDPLAEGVVEFSREIDARLLDRRMRATREVE